MKKILSQRQRVPVARFSLVFDSLTMPGAGYSFDCDAGGKLHDLTEVQRASYAAATDTAHYRPLGVQDFSYSYIEPAVLQCHCGQHVTLDDPLENQCECGRAYNMCGQEVRANYGRAECLADGCAWDENDY